MANCVEFWGEVFTMGCQGPQGIQGPEGPAGPAGPAGPEGPPSTSDCGVLRSLSSAASTGSFQAKIDQNVIFEGGTYIFWWTCRYSGSNQSTEFEFRVEVNGEEVDILPADVVGESDTDLTWPSFDIVQLPQGSANVKFEHRQPGGAGALTVSHFKVAYILLKPLLGAFGSGGSGGPS